MWTAHSDGNIDYELAKYQAYMTTLEDIESGKLDLPEIEDQKAFVDSIKRHVRKEFVERAVTTDLKHNKYHRFMYAYCVKSFLDNLSEGTFAGPGGRVKQLPSVAEAIDDHVEELLTNSLLET